MDQTHIHLLITHLPIFGSILGGIVLAYGLYVKSNDTLMAAYILFVFSALGAFIAYFTGEAAEESVENIQGVVESTIETHEEFAFIALVSLIILGVVSILGMYLTSKKSPLIRVTAFVILIISFISFGLVARTGYLGGQIRHTEVYKNGTNPSENSEKEIDD